MIRSTFNRRSFVFTIAVALCIFSVSFPQRAHASTSVLSFINSFFPASTSSSTTAAISQSDLASLTTPGIVQLAAYSTGTVMLNSDFNVDWVNFTVTPVPLPTPYPIPVSNYATGTGFIISPDGYVLTNSHVVSQQGIIDAAMANLEQVLVANGIKSLSKADQKTFQQNASTTDGMAKFENLEAVILQDLISYSSSSIATTVTVFDPTSSATSLPALIASGFPAKIINVDNNFANDQKDVAVLQINQVGLPALALAPQGTIDSSGVFSAFNNDFGTDGFELVQSDQNGTGGIRGSPLLDDKGEVVGMLGASFVVPLSTIWSILNQSSVDPIAGDLYTHFMNGLALASASHCAEAIDEFSAAKSANDHFPVNDFVSSYIQTCQDLQASGGSIDSDWDQFKININSIKTPLIIGGSVLVLLILLLIIISVVRRITRRNVGTTPRVQRMGHMSQDIPVYKTTMSPPPVSAQFNGINVMPKGPYTAPVPPVSNSVQSTRLVDTPVYVPPKVTPQVPPQSFTQATQQPMQHTAPSTSGPTMTREFGNNTGERTPESFSSTMFTAGPRSTPAPISFTKPAPAPTPVSAPTPIASVPRYTPAPIPLSKEKVAAAVAYLAQQEKLGISEGQMLIALRSQGYTEGEIEHAFGIVESMGR